MAGTGTAHSTVNKIAILLFLYCFTVPTLKTRSMPTSRPTPDNPTAHRAGAELLPQLLIHRQETFAVTVRCCHGPLELASARLGITCTLTTTSSDVDSMRFSVSSMAPTFSNTIPKRNTRSQVATLIL